MKTLLNLGCGAGHHDHALKPYFQITGSDISEPMLNLARELNPEIEYIQGDMRTLNLNREFDVVTAFDSLDYMRTEADLRSVFETAYRHLKPGGVFLTVLDMTKESFSQNRTGITTHSGSDADVSYIENYYDPDPADSICECTMVYLIRQKGKLSIETDLHVCGLFPLQTWMDLFPQTGFDLQMEAYTETGFDSRTYPVLIGVRT